MNTFQKEERLCSRKLIDKLFQEGSSFHLYPFKVVWLPVPLESSFPAQLSIAVPKKNFKKAVSRNKIKRQIREIYRVNKQVFYDFLTSNGKQFALMIIYVAKVPLPFKELEMKIILTLQRLEKEYEESTK